MPANNKSHHPAEINIKSVEVNHDVKLITFTTDRLTTQVIFDEYDEWGSVVIHGLQFEWHLMLDENLDVSLYGLSWDENRASSIDMSLEVTYRAKQVGTPPNAVPKDLILPDNYRATRISSAHLSTADIRVIDGVTSSGLNDQILKGATGYMFKLYVECLEDGNADPDFLGLSQNLITLLKHVMSEGFEILEFDHNGEVLEGLPVYN